MTTSSSKELIATARKWNDRIGNPLARGVMSSAEINIAVTAIETALSAAEAAQADLAARDATSLPRTERQVTAEYALYAAAERAARKGGSLESYECEALVEEIDAAEGEATKIAANSNEADDTFTRELFPGIFDGLDRLTIRTTPTEGATS